MRFPVLTGVYAIIPSGTHFAVIMCTSLTLTELNGTSRYLSLYHHTRILSEERHLQDLFLYNPIIPLRLPNKKRDTSATIEKKKREHGCLFDAECALVFWQWRRGEVPWRSCARGFRPGRSPRSSCHSLLYWPLAGGTWLVAAETTHILYESSSVEGTHTHTLLLRVWWWVFGTITWLLSVTLQKHLTAWRTWRRVSHGFWLKDMISIRWWCDVILVLDVCHWKCKM